MLEYTFILFKDIYTLSNTSITESLNYDLKKLSGCYEYSTIDEGNILINTSKIFNNLKDGEYELVLTQGLNTTTITFKYYPTLQKSLIESITEVICECNCSDCKDCNSCDNNLLTLLKLNSYLSITSTNTTINTNYKIISDELLCNLITDVECISAQEMVLGTTDTELLLKNILSLHYLVLYFTEINLVTTEEIDYIKEKYNFISLVKCIRNLGINPSKIEELIS